MFIIYVTLATKILNRQLIYPKMSLTKQFIYFQRLNHSYKFMLIPTEFTSLIKEIFGS